MIRGSLSVSFPRHKSPLCQVWLPLVLQKRRYFAFDLSRDLTPLRDQRVMWHNLIVMTCVDIFFSFFLYQSFLSRTLTTDSPDSRGREGAISYSTLPLPPIHEHSDIYLQLCMWDDYHIFLIETLVFTRLLPDEIYHFIELPFDWLMMWH